MKKKILIGLGILFILFLWAVISIYPDWLWFENLDFAPVFWTMLLSKFGFGFVVWLPLMIIIVINIAVATRLHPDDGRGMNVGDMGGYLSQVGLSGRALNTILLAFVLILSLVIASKGSDHWDMVLRYLYQKPFESTDPIFNKDIGFYVFSLPLYILVQEGLMVFFVFAGLITIAWYLKGGALQIAGDLNPAEGAPPSLPKITISEKAKKHLVFILGIIVLILAWRFYLKIYGLLYSTQGPAFGASYTDVYFKVWAYRILIILSLGLAVILFMDVFRSRKKLIWLSGGIWLGAVLLFGTGLPTLIQKIVVKPNELAKESPYIAYNIEHTRKAYNLDKIKVVDFEVSNTLKVEDIEKHDVTIQNIRIWDERPLLQTYKQIQAIRLYYDFNNVDVDRYLINDRYRQLMLAARELVINKLPPKANTWVNRHLIYTHGYGLAASSVNEVDKEGLPHLFIKDVPPVSDPDLKVERPEIYYGEKTEQYVLIKTKTKEFDYPKGDKNVYSLYQGKGGVPINSFVRRVLFAFEFFDPQILFTNYLNPESRIMFKRRIDKRVAAIAPFLNYDGDPYIVVSGGKLYWIQDAYTSSDMYPYSRRSKTRFRNATLNYIRNSVKVIIDAYNGDVSFYIVDEKDPIVQTYSSIFPDLFKPFNDMPADLKKHIRYPRDLFKIQVDTYTKYHMEDAQVFYNQEDLWEIPDEVYGDSRQKMEPYYIIIKVPEGDKEEFLLMIPFTPSKKDNMIAWLAARSDLPNYGNLLVYKLPKEKLIYGPMQLEARIDQQTDISRELSLWGQKGSRVIRGNLLAIPISDSFVYVEPVYLEAIQEASETPASGTSQPKGFRKPQGTQATGPSQTGKSRSAALPELKRVIVAYGNRVIMEETLDRSLRLVLGGEIGAGEMVSTFKPGAHEASESGALALEHYNKAKEYLRQGNWAGYGRELEHLEEILQEMSGTNK